MNITWVTRFPTGHEQGRYLTLDMGGTNLRICEITLSPQPGEYEASQRKYKLPGHLRSAPGDDLWDFAADCVGSFLHEHHQGGQCEEKLPLAFAFSYPVEQTSIKSGKLQYWTKDFSSPGVEGHDVVLQLEEALDRKVCCFPLVICPWLIEKKNKITVESARHRGLPSQRHHWNPDRIRL